jgi:glycosyltransferase involved in cell wall biosynthesis
MRILFLLTQDLESPSGLGRYWPLAKWLAQMGHEVEIAALHPNWPALRQRRFEREGVRVAYVAPMHVRRAGNRQEYYAPAALLWVTLRATLALFWAALRSPAECIHIGKAQPMNGLAGWLAASLRGRRLFLDCDDYEAASNRFGGNWQRRIVGWWEDRLPRLARGVTVNTTFLAQRCQRLGVPAARLILVPNGFDPARFISPTREAVEQVRRQWGLDDGSVILYLGSLSLANHPVLMLLDALVEVVKQAPQARLCLAGGGDDFDRVRSEVAARGLGAAVIMPGRIDPALAPALYAASTVVVDPVEADDTARARSPLKIVEALACGVPVVTGDVGDRNAMLAGGQAGVLVSPGSALALAGALVSLLRDPARRASLAAGARAASSAYQWDRLAIQFAGVYAV